MRNSVVRTGVVRGVIRIYDEARGKWMRQEVPCRNAGGKWNRVVLHGIVGVDIHGVGRRAMGASRPGEGM